MKRVLLVVGLLVAIATQASAQTWPPVAEWGPGGTLNGATSPTYALPITVLDSIRATVPAGDQRRTWTRLRNEALAEWTLPFVVQNAPDLPVTAEGWVPPTNTIALVRAEVLYGQGNIQAGAYLADSGSGIVTISFQSGWCRWPGMWRSYIGHEVGHALGFGHPYADDFMGAAPGRWIMGSGYHPAADEIAAVQGYYA